MSRPIYVYALYEPSSEFVCYIGKTTTPQTRFDAHCRPGYGSRAMQEWTYQLAEAGHKPRQVILETCTEDTVKAAEYRWILHYAELGQVPLNVRYKGSQNSKESAFEFARATGLRLQLPLPRPARRTTRRTTGEKGETNG